MIKKITIIKTAVILFILIIGLTPSFSAQAKTVANLRSELQALQAAAQNVNNKIIYTNAQINQAKIDIAQLYKDIDYITTEIEKTTNKIIELSDNIAKKDKETKDLISFVQISNSDSIYMEYIAGATSLTDFIYRVSVSQQLIEYNNDLIKQMNQMIAESNQKKVLLAQQEEQSRQKQQQLSKNLDILGSQKQQLSEYNISLADEIKIAMAALDMYVRAGCKDNDDINVCTRGLLPPDTSFWRPMDKGCVSSEYGWRNYQGYKFHDGIDLTNNSTTYIYASAAGRVVASGYHSSMGNYLYLHHSINGKTYTTIYLHLLDGSKRVSVGQIVNKNTILATMGSTGNSSGPHLHFAVATGLYTQDYTSYSTFVSKTINPRNMVNIPAGYYNYWYDRIKKY